jgi:hypothetical protein
MPEREFDAIVIGAGAPERSARAASADGGLAVAIVETAPGRRRVLLLRLHALEGAAAAGRAAGEARRVPGTSAAVTGELDPRRRSTAATR